MNTDEFEKRLQRQPLRQVPPEWRAEILSAARQAALPQATQLTAGHADTSRSLLSTLYHQLSALLWPHPAAWAGMAAVWVVILGLNLATHDVAPLVAEGGSSPSPQVFMAFQEQQRLLTELLGPPDMRVADRQKPAPRRPGSEPRSDLRHRLLIA